MSQKKVVTKQTKTVQDNSLLDRVVLILEQARTNVVRAVNFLTHPNSTPNGRRIDNHP